MLLFIASLFLFPQKGELDSVKVLVAFGASVNTTNYRGQTPLDLATMGYLHQERKLSLTNAALNRHLVRQRRESSPQIPNQRPAPPTHTHKESPLLSKIVPKRPKYVNINFDGVMCVLLGFFNVNIVHCFHHFSFSQTLRSDSYSCVIHTQDIIAIKLAMIS